MSERERVIGSDQLRTESSQPKLQGKASSNCISVKLLQLKIGCFDWCRGRKQKGKTWLPLLPSPPKPNVDILTWATTQKTKAICCKYCLLNTHQILQVIVLKQLLHCQSSKLFAPKDTYYHFLFPRSIMSGELWEVSSHCWSQELPLEQLKFLF